jgi:hypothetical protein
LRPARAAPASWNNLRILDAHRDQFGSRHDLERRVELSALLRHRAHRAVVFFRQLDRVFHCLRRNVVAFENVVNADVVKTRGGSEPDRLQPIAASLAAGGLAYNYLGTRP